MLSCTFEMVFLRNFDVYTYVYHVAFNQFMVGLTTLCMMYHSKIDRQILKQKFFMPTNQQHMNNSILVLGYFSNVLKPLRDEIRECFACQSQFDVLIQKFYLNDINANKVIMLDFVICMLKPEVKFQKNNLFLSNYIRFS